MNQIEILSLPEILFSHVYEAEAYRNHFPARTDFIELTYLAEGALELTVGKERICARKGDLICLLHHEETAVTAEQFHRHHTVGARVEWRFSPEHPTALRSPTVLPADSEHRRIIDDFLRRTQHYKEFKAEGAAKFLELLCAVDRACRRTRQENLPSEQIYAERAKAYIQDHIREPITQAAVAARLGVSPEYLCTVFKKAEGCPMMQYINRLKLGNIKVLMEHTHLHLYEAAALYGYNDPNYVSRLYKRLFGHNITDKPTLKKY